MASSAGWSSHRGLVLLGFCLAALAATLTIATGTARANATVPGTNGKIAFSSDRDNLSMNCQTVNTDAFDNRCRFEIYTMNPDGSGLTRLTNNTWKDDKPSWSPDGTQIAFESRRNCAGAANDPNSNANGNCFSNIFVMDQNGGNVRQLTFDSDSDTNPTWSPDGTQIAFERGDPDSNNGAPDRIYLVPAAGGPEKLIDTLGDPTATNASPDRDTLPAWSPNGDEIALTRISGNFFNIFGFGGASTRASGSFQSFLAGEGTEEDLASGVSPLAAQSRAFDNNATFWVHTFVQNADGSGVANPVGDIDACTGGKFFLTQCVFDTNPAWSPDGARLAIQRRLLGCAADAAGPGGLPLLAGNQICFNDAGHAVNDVDIVTMPRDGSAPAILNANEPADCGPETASSPGRPQCFSDHKPAFAPENNALAFHSDRVAVTTNADRGPLSPADFPLPNRSCRRGFFFVPFGSLFTTECAFNIHTMNLLGTSVSAALAPAGDPVGNNAPTNIDPDWQPIFLAPTSFAFISGCSTDGVVPVGTIANSPGKGAVAAVHFQIDGGVEQTVPVSNGFATINVPNGRHTLTYWAVNQAGVAESPHTATVVVDTVNHCGSAIGVRGVRTLASCASRGFVARFAVSSAVGIRRVQVFLDSRLVKTTTSGSFALTVNVNRLRNGRHVLRTVVTDVNGQTLSSTRTFRVCRAQVRRPRPRRAHPRFTG